jgi:transcriptional regulator with XRE-family HTH domain
MGTKARPEKESGRVKPEHPTPPPVPFQDEKVVLNLGAVREQYGLSRATFARMLGVSDAALARLERGDGQLDKPALARVERIRRVLGKAVEVMRREYIPTWVKKPSAACKELGASAPIDLMEKGDFDSIEDLLFFLGSGVPY